MQNTFSEDLKKEKWYIELCEEGKYTFDLIYKYHNYFSKQDKKYRHIVRILRILILTLSMVNTIVLGMKTIISTDCQVVWGLVISALITYVTTISAYFNFEEYWMRNVAIHIELNILRDNFVLEAKAGKLAINDELKKYKHKKADKSAIDDELKKYQQKLDDIQQKNIEYWQKSLKKIR